MMNEDFNKLDKSKAGLRILHLLLGNMEFTQSELQRHVHEQGVGARAFKSSLEILHELGLVVTQPKIRKGNQVKVTYLTEYGDTIAASVNRIYNDLRKFVILEMKD